MPNSPTTVMWRDVPAGSVLRLQSDGSLDDYELPVSMTLNKAPQPGLEGEDLNPGPAEIPLGGPNQRWNLSPTIIVMTSLKDPITLTASVLKDGQVVKVPAANGKTKPAEATWRSAKNSGSMLDIRLFVRTVTS